MGFKSSYCVFCLLTHDWLLKKSVGDKPVGRAVIILRDWVCLSLIGLLKGLFVCQLGLFAKKDLKRYSC